VNVLGLASSRSDLVEPGLTAPPIPGKEIIGSHLAGLRRTLAELRNQVPITQQRQTVPSRTCKVRVSGHNVR